MSKLQIVDPDLETSVPFLRGVLTHSLQNAGLEFNEAYELATEIRERLNGSETIKRDNLRKLITDILKEKYPDTVLSRYKKDPYYRESIIVRYENSEEAPFSRGLHSQSLEICSLPLRKCSAITRLINNQLIREKRREITSAELIELTYQLLCKEVGKKTAEKYRTWSVFKRSNIPLLVLIGGVPCSGKSSIASEVGNRLGIIRVQSTDMLREVMRSLIPESLSPVLHQSTFNAGNVLKPVSVIDANQNEIMLNGFHRQAEMVGLACESVLQRAQNERVSIILEGVHIRNTLMDKIKDYQAVVVPIMIGVLNKKQLRRNIKGRRSESKERRAQRYLENIDAIWKLQSMLLSESDAEDIQVINNEDMEETIQEIIRLVVKSVTKNYKILDEQMLESEKAEKSENPKQPVSSIDESSLARPAIAKSPRTEDAKPKTSDNIVRNIMKYIVSGTKNMDK